MSDTIVQLIRVGAHASIKAKTLTSRRIPMSLTRLAAAFAACAELAMISNVASAAEANDAAAEIWSTYSHDYPNTRHTDLSQINVKNIASMVPLWQYQTGQVASFETSPKCSAHDFKMFRK